MRTGDRLPVLPDTRSVQDAILGMTQAKAGCAALIDEATGRLTGILTDGDFRRGILSGPDFLAQPVSGFMTRTPKTVGAEALAWRPCACSTATRSTISLWWTRRPAGGDRRCTRFAQDEILVRLRAADGRR